MGRANHTTTQLANLLPTHHRHATIITPSSSSFVFLAILPFSTASASRRLFHLFLGITQQFTNTRTETNPSKDRKGKERKEGGKGANFLFPGDYHNRALYFFLKSLLVDCYQLLIFSPPSFPVPDLEGKVGEMFACGEGRGGEGTDRYFFFIVVKVLLQVAVAGSRE